MPNRIIKESICTSETLDQLTAEEERLFFRLTVNCDDFGVFNPDPQYLKEKCFPLKSDVTVIQVEKWLLGLAKAEIVEILSDRHGRVIDWQGWQTPSTTRRSAYAGKRRACKLNATPAWANLESIEEMYRKATELTKQTGIEHHVDHVIPLQGKTVCGLHVEDNLRVITAKENISKGSKFNG